MRAKLWNLIRDIFLYRANILEAAKIPSEAPTRSSMRIPFVYPQLLALPWDGLTDYSPSDPNAAMSYARYEWPALPLPAKWFALC